MEGLGIYPVSTFWAGKRVLVTGHTGFKGSWLSTWLQELGAHVYGLALAPVTDPSLFDELGLAGVIDHKVGDIRDAETVTDRVKNARPDVVFHLAAQPLVLASYAEPLVNWDANVMGTAHVLDALRKLQKPCAAVMITTDKVYENPDSGEAFAENARLGGHDPYAASKAACEILISSYRASFFGDHPVRVTSARAGNVIGGGDWAENRILPDIIRALAAGQPIPVRNPTATRPWQHVLEPLSGYLRLAEAAYTGAPHAPAYNFGPDPDDTRPVRDVVETALQTWPGSWEDRSDPKAHKESKNLSLSIDLAKRDLGYSPRWAFDEGVARTVRWYKAVTEGGDAAAIIRSQIRDFGAP
ncbi:MAG: CDP-glucose 4,6-dehydratase [Pseudomonadota bacterium]